VFRVEIQLRRFAPISVWGSFLSSEQMGTGDHLTSLLMQHSTANQSPLRFRRQRMHALLAVLTEAISYMTSNRWQTFIAAAAALLTIWVILMLTR
jgi:hypothetical protein